MLKWLVFMTLAVALFVLIAVGVAQAVAFILVSCLFVVLPLSAAADAINIPDRSWAARGQRRSAWIVAFFFFPFAVNVFSSLAYWTWLRRQLPGGPLKAGEEIEFTSGSYAGQHATLLRPYMLGAGGIWTASVETRDGAATVQVSSKTFSRA